MSCRNKALAWSKQEAAPFTKETPPRAIQQKHAGLVSNRAAKFTKNKNDQWNHAGGFSLSICAGLSSKMQPKNN